MLTDDYKLNVQKRGRGSRSGVNANMMEFIQLFERYYTSIRLGLTPDFYHQMADPYGFALMCEDYRDKPVKYDTNKTCREVFEGEGVNDDISLPTYHGIFSFKELLSILYHGFLFDYDKAMAIYKNQGDAFHLFNQIVNGDGLVSNKLRKGKRHARKNNATPSIIHPNEDKPIGIPHVWRMCDGLPAPFIVMKFHHDMRIEKCDCGNFADGLFLISDDEVIDVLRINDTWFDDMPLENRLRFAYACRDYPVASYVKAWSWRSAFEAARMLGADRDHGVLVRGCRDDFYYNQWFNWSRSSVVFTKKVPGCKRVSEATFFNLEGEPVDPDPFEERKYQRVFLDEFDIGEFQLICQLE